MPVRLSQRFEAMGFLIYLFTLLVISGQATLTWGRPTPGIASTGEIQESPTTSPSILGCILPLIVGDAAGRDAIEPDPRNYINSVDALYVLTGIADLHRPEPACSPEDVDCDGDRDAVDALWILRWISGLPMYQHEPCPDIGTELQ